MLRKIFNEKARSITSAAIIIGGASLASRLLGVIRDRVLASQFGVGDYLDVYYAAFRIPDMVFNLIVIGALSAGFIPLFSDFLEIEKEKAWRFAQTVLSVLVVVLLVVCGLLALGAPWLMKYITPGFSPEKLEMVVQLTRIMFLSPLILGVSSFFGGILQSFKRFFVYSLAPIMYNIGIIIGALVFVQWWGMYGLALGVILGALFHLAIQIPTAYYLGFRFEYVWNPFDAQMRELVRIMIPRTLGLAVAEINFIVMTIVATMLAAGSLTIFNFAFNIQSFPLGVFGISFAIAAFPTLCEYARSDKDRFRESFSNTVRQVLFFIVPIALLFLILRAQIVRVILGGGLFDWSATTTTAFVLGVFTLSLVPQALIPLFARGFFAYKDSKTPLLVAFVGALITSIGAYFLSQPLVLGGYEIMFGVGGVALAYTVASYVQLGLLWVFLHYKVQGIGTLRIMTSFAKIGSASVVMGFVTQFMKFGVEPFFGTQTFVGIFLQGFLSGIVGLGMFVLVGLFLEMEELTTVIGSLKKRLFVKKEFLGEEGIDSTVE